VIKRVRRLRRRTYRDREGVFVVEGRNLLNEAINSGAKVKELLFVADRAIDADIMRRTLDPEPVTYEITGDILRWVSEVVTSQGILGVVGQVDSQYDEIVGREVTFVLIADQVRDPGNMGALVRVADAAGMDGLLATAGSVDLYNPKVVRSAAGSHFHIPTGRDAEMRRLTADLGAAGVKTLGLDSRGDTDYRDVDYSLPVAIAVGNEAFGFSDEDRGLMDGTIRIDMPGRAESLNVASSAAVVLFEALRQRRNA
jgi:TrmH family RNA methyltransferase